MLCPRTNHDAPRRARARVLALSCVLTVFNTTTTEAQQPVDLSSWFSESYAPVTGSGNYEAVWTVEEEGFSALQSLNAQPSVFCSDFEAFNTTTQGQIAVETSADNDFTGFALGFNPGDATNPDADYLLVDWKQSTQTADFSPACTSGGAAPEGLAVSRVRGIPTADEFWNHADFDNAECSPLGNGLEELQRGATLGDSGWPDLETTTFTFEFDPTQLRVFVNGTLEVDVVGEFSPGRLCFYNLSQEMVRYSGYTLEGLDPFANQEPFPPQPPIAIAGADQQVSEGALVSLDASASFDPNELQVTPSSEQSVLPGGATVSSSLNGLEVRGSGVQTLIADASVGAESSATITAITLTIDGGEEIDVSSSADASLPQQGEATVEIQHDLFDLGAASRMLCLNVYATDSIGTESVSACASTIDASGPLTYEWTLIDVDGPSIALSSTTSPTPSFATVDDGTYELELTATNVAGLSDTDRVQVTVANAKPQLVVDPIEGTAGDLTVLSVAYTGEGWLDTHSGTVDWGDGSVTPLTVATGSGWGTGFASHRYSAAGTYTVDTTLIDDDNGIATSTVSAVNVSEAPALWADNAWDDKAIYWIGSDAQATGLVHSNAGIEVIGLNNDFNGPVEYATNFYSASQNSYAIPPAQSATAEPPVTFTLADYQPGGLAAIAAGDRYFDATSECVQSGWFWDRQASGPLDPGLYLRLSTTYQGRIPDPA